jgi:hypothetical protein
LVGRGKEGPEKINSRGNKGRQMGKHSRGRLEDRGEPSMAASMQIGYLDPMITYAQIPEDNGVIDLTYS